MVDPSPPLPCRLLRRWRKATGYGTALLLQAVPLAAVWADAAAPRRTLPPTTYARMMMALVGLAILGAGLMVLVWLGGRYVRKLARHGVPSRYYQDDDSWYRKPLVPPNPLGETPDDKQQPV